MTEKDPESQQHVPPGCGSRQPASEYRVPAQPTPSGFFGLSQLLEYTNSIVDPYAENPAGIKLILDFSLVKVWDVAALLWLVVALHYYRHNVGLSYRLKLPEGRLALDPKRRSDFDRSADFLRRWRFDRALGNIVPLVDDLLVEEQRGYFEGGPNRYYLDKTVADQQGLMHSLISRRLVEIRSLADPKLLGPVVITPDRITECVSRFQSERIGDILHSQCGIEKRVADLFSDHLLTEALMNVQEHPNATIGLVAISVLGASKELILAVADNGDSIPSTIFGRYLREHPTCSAAESPAAARYEPSSLSREARADITDFATQPGVSRKDDRLADQTGMGLTYIKQDTIKTFCGKLRILTDSVSLRYSPDASDQPEQENWPHRWRGNLLRIAIPLHRSPTPAAADADSP